MYLLSWASVRVNACTWEWRSHQLATIRPARPLVKPIRPFPGDMKFIKWWTLMIHEHSSMVHQASSWTVFMNCSSKTVYDKSWILMNTWWTNVAQDLVHEVHMGGSWTVIIFYELGWSNLVHIACSWKFIREFHELWWIIMNLINPNSVHG